MTAWHGSRTAALLVLGLAAGASQASSSLLPASAFQAPRACQVDPYADANPDQREQALAQACGADRMRLKVDGPRVRPDGTEDAPVLLRADQVLTRRAGPLTASVRVGWGAQRDERDRLQTDHALLAARSQIRLAQGLALDMKVGRDVGANLPTRATVSGLWRPTSRQMLFAEVAPEAGGVAGAVGLRWWLVSKRLVLDLAAHRPADGSEIEPRLGLKWLRFGE